jgi:NAD-dependent SIR2 family protein deacetylase
VNIDEALERAATAIMNADAIIFTSGAGLGVDSGLPDFRGPEGFWKAYPPLKDLGLSFSGMSNPKWFKDDPPFAWGFWSHRYNLYSKSPPHAGYDIMKKWGEELVNNNYFVFTSNVDGHFLKKGFPQDKVVECHGTVHLMQCSKNCNNIWPATDFVIPEYDKMFRAIGELPKCPNCTSVIRPNVLMFYDGGYITAVNFLQRRNYKSFFKNLKEDCKLVVIEIGAGNFVPTVRYESEHTSSQLNGTLIRINPGDYEVPESYGDKAIPLPLGGLAALQRIDEIIQSRKNNDNS